MSVTFIYKVGNNSRQYFGKVMLGRHLYISDDADGGTDGEIKGLLVRELAKHPNMKWIQRKHIKVGILSIISGHNYLANFSSQEAKCFDFYSDGNKTWINGRRLKSVNGNDN